MKIHKNIETKKLNSGIKMIVPTDNAVDSTNNLTVNGNLSFVLTSPSAPILINNEKS